MITTGKDRLHYDLKLSVSESRYLLADGTPRAKDQLAEALWPEASPSQLRSSMHSALRELRRAIQRPDWFVFQGGAYRFAPGAPLRFTTASSIDSTSRKIPRARFARVGSQGR